jgi:CRISPR-associated protein Csb2
MDSSAAPEVFKKHPAPAEVPLPLPGGPQGFRWRIDGDLPPVEATLAVGEAVRDTIYGAARRKRHWPLPDWFHAEDDPGHRHAMWLPEDDDGDGMIDHVLMFCDRGLPDGLAPVLAGGGEVWLGRLGEFRLLPDWMGRRAPGALFGPSTSWRSATPFVTMRWRTRKGGAIRPPELTEHQVLRETKSRGLPALVRLDTGTRLASGPTVSDFLLSTDDRKPPADAIAASVRLVFKRPVWGPLALGFGCHFGLGLFEPMTDGTMEEAP